MWLEVGWNGRVSVALSFFRGFDGVTGSRMRRGCSTTQAGVIPTGKTFKTKPGRSSRALYSRQAPGMQDVFITIKNMAGCVLSTRLLIHIYSPDIGGCACLFTLRE